MALPSSLKDDFLLASTWDYAGTTRHATPRRRTPTTSFQHLWHKHRSTARETSPRRHCVNTPWHVCRTTSTVRFSFFTPPSVPPSSSSPIRPRVPVATYASPHASTPTQQSRKGVVWQPRTRRWTHHNDNIAGSSDARSKNRRKLRANGTIASVAFSSESNVCQPTTSALNYKNLWMWGRYSPIDTSPHKWK
jgi:hypothetical protein